MSQRNRSEVARDISSSLDLSCAACHLRKLKVNIPHCARAEEEWLTSEMINGDTKPRRSQQEQLLSDLQSRLASL